MDWVELHLNIEAGNTARAEDALTEAGALAITLRDCGNHPLLEPAPGETPLWPMIRLTGLFPSTTRPADVERVLRQQLGQVSFDLTLSNLGERAWERVWLDHFGPLRFGDRLWVCPPELSPDVEGDSVIVWLDPGLAFGTGTHPTTALCLRHLDARPPRGLRVVDYGCGSGILAIAALKLGAALAHCVDIDPQALTACGSNAERNAVADRLTTHDAGCVPADCELLIANIIARPLLQLAPEFARLLKPGGRLMLSGLLEEQADAVAARYARDFDIDTMDSLEGWSLIGASRK